MKKGCSFKDDHAVSEVIGGILLVMIAIAAFSVIFLDTTSKDYVEYNKNIKIAGSVNDQGIIELEHMYGDVIDDYTIKLYYPNDTFIGSKSVTDDNWAIGQCKSLKDITSIRLLDENSSLKVYVYTNNEDGKEQEIFKAELFGSVPDIAGFTPPVPDDNSSWDPDIPLLISSLQTYTFDEDLICYSLPTNVNMTPLPGFFDCDIDMDWQVDSYDVELVEEAYGSSGSPGWIREDVNNDGTVDYLDVSSIVSQYGDTKLSYVYNWIVNSNSIYDILMPFDTDDSISVFDYSGDENHGIVNDASWSSDGIIGGCYSFDGDDSISIPYCFDSEYIDDLTVETWIKTSEDEGAIGMYDPNNYWSLDLVDGKIRWSTSVDGEPADLNGNIVVNDNNWHHVAASYDSSNGNSAVFVDGKYDTSSISHNPGDLLGGEGYPNGYVGSSNGSEISGSWDLLTYDDFEEGLGNYSDGGRDCTLYTSGAYAHQGSNAVNIQDDNGYWSSFYHTNSIDINSPGYTSIKVDFWFYADSMEWGEDFYVRFYDGSSWRIVADYDCGDEFVNDQFYHEIVWINETDYNFPSNMKILFQCDASYDSDDIYIDQIYVNATTGVEALSDFTGCIDEFHIYNRVLSDEQIYQNYLCSKDGFSDLSVIVSEETNIFDFWKCIMTPNDTNQNGESVESETVLILSLIHI